MPTEPISLPRAVTRGMVAGAVGTLAMDLVWYSRYRRGGGQDGFLDWEFSSSTTGFENAGAPAQVGKRIVHTVTRKDLPDRVAGLTNNMVHWATGSQWGALYGIVTRSTTDPSPAHGPLLGPAAWGTAYALLGAAGIYEPIWRYDTKTLAKDLSAHLVFGVATAAAYRIMDRHRIS
ncbi:MAG: hypothetical protein U5K30_09695 [Acidimicrobiales bacterium]|nr:hypothetical protein [Acidimicrobiales bacterium]